MMRKKVGFFMSLPLWQVVCEFSFCCSVSSCTVRLLAKFKLLSRTSNKTCVLNTLNT